MLTWLRPLVGIAIVLALIVAPLLYAIQQERGTRNFRVVHEDLLYRSGQMTVPALRRIVHDYNIRTVVCLRDSAVSGKENTSEQAEQEFCEKENLLYVRIPPRAWEEGRDGSAPVDEGIRTFLEVMADPHNHPVLVHCFAGIHRTGAYLAVYRMEHDGWTNEQAIAELEQTGYENLDVEFDILGYLERYTGRDRFGNEPRSGNRSPGRRRQRRRLPANMR